MALQRRAFARRGPVPAAGLALCALLLGGRAFLAPQAGAAGERRAPVGTERRRLLLLASTLGFPDASWALSKDEKRVAQLFEATTPSVVSIAKTPPQAVVGGEEKMGGQIYGTGFVWDRQHVVTNFHVLNSMDAPKPYVTFLDKDQQRTTVNAEVVGSDAASDIAVLRVGARTRDNAAVPGLMRPLPLGESDGLVVGQDVFAFGNPFGLEHSLSRGIVSGVARTMDGAGGRPINGVIQTDASINPGNSGGPLLDSDGKVIGVNTAILTGSGTFAGVGLAIPIDTVRRNVESIISKGFVKRAFLGIVFAPDVMAEELQLNGIMVMRVVKGGPAETAGVQPMRGGRLGDIVVGIDGKSITTSNDLYKFLDSKQPGDTVTLSVKRAAVDANSDTYQDATLKVTLGVAGEKEKGEKSEAPGK